MTPNQSADALDERPAALSDGEQALPEHHHEDHAEDSGDVVAIRRNILLSGVVGVLGALIGLAFLARSESALDRPLGLLLLALASLHLLALGSWRVPVLVADAQGIRLRLGLSWRGLPWPSIRQIVVEHAESPLREGRLVVVARDLGATADGLDPLARLHLRWNRFWYDAPLAVPLGMTTFIDTPSLAADLRALSEGKVDVADLRGSNLAQLAEVPVRPVAVEPPAAQDDDVALVPTWSMTEPADEATAVLDEEPVEESVEETGPIEFEDPFTAPPTLPADEPVLVAWTDDEPPAEELPPPPEDDLVLPPPVSPLREIRHAIRAEVRLDRFHRHAAGEHAADEAEAVATPEVPGQRRPGEIAALLAGAELPAYNEPTAQTDPAVIGAKIEHAREMLDMSIEELSNRTRIRPHVLEAMEVDDFGPCGGDVYARGHLSSVARILGLNVEALMAVYDERYAQGPINARRVFEAEMATGQSGGMRATFGGPRWSLLISAVLCLTMVWGLARMFAGDPQDLAAAPGAGDVAVQSGNRQPITSPLMNTTPMTVTAAHAAAHIVVRDRTGRILWSGDLEQGRHRKVVGLAPFKVESDNAGAVEVMVKGKALGTVGLAGASGAKKFG